MRYVDTPDGGAWLLSLEEQAALSARAQEGSALDQSPRRRLHSCDSMLGGIEAAWASASPRLELHPSVTARLKVAPYVFVDASQVHVPASRVPAVLDFMQRYDELQYQPFGGPGLRGFFASRTIQAAHLIFAPGAAEDAGDASFERMLAGAVIRSLPDYDAKSWYSVGLLLSRHAASADAMPAHHDSVEWLALFNVSTTDGVAGGEVALVDDLGEVVHQQPIRAFMEGYVLRDRMLRHSTTSIEMRSDGEQHRDVVVLRIANCGAASPLQALGGDQGE